MIWGQVVVNSLLLGGLYALVGVGLSLVWGITNILNFAHGGMLMLGAYITYWLFALYGIDPFLSIPISMIALFLFGLAVFYLLLAGVLKRSHFGFRTLLLMFALEMFMANAASLLWTADFRSVRPAYAGRSMQLGGVIVPLVDLAVVGVAAMMILLLWFFLRRTRMGQAILATGLDPEAAQLMGIGVQRIYALTFAIGAALAGAAGSLVATTTAINPYFGGSYTFLAALAAIVGGLGSIPGVMIGGVIVALAETLGSVLISPAYRMFVSFVILVLVLLVRPTGVLGGKFFGQMEAEE
jgi:branched-chain amino acid transport system permease protein